MSATTYKPPFSPLHPQCVGCSNFARQGSDKCGTCLAKDEAENNREQTIRNVADAIEAFTDAKIRQFDANIAGRSTCAGTSYQIDVTETREHMRDKLRELLP